MTGQLKLVADLDFPEGGANSQIGCANLLFYNFFAENCIKMTEFEPGACIPGIPLNPPISSTIASNNMVFYLQSWCCFHNHG